MRSFACALFLGFCLYVAAPTRAADLDTYTPFTATATEQTGLFGIWRKNGHIYIDLTTDQLSKDFLETIVPGNGLGASFLVWGNTDHLPAMLVRFERADDKIAIVWPNTSFIGSRAVLTNFPQSVVGAGKIVAEGNGHIVFDASPLYKDVLDLDHIINTALKTKTLTAYRLDPERTYFGTVKDFPQNVVFHVEQLWQTREPHIQPDTAPDARSLQMDVVYNFAQLPADSYTPRYADDRVGIYDDIYMDFAPRTDLSIDRRLRYLIRWNFAPADPTKPSRATHPMVFYLSNTIPQRFRKPIAGAVLAWNAALERAGIIDAIQVKDQPSDANWDSEDIRYNVLRWITEERSSFGADSQTLYNPLTGEEFRTGILISADIAARAAATWRNEVDPVRNGRTTDPVPEQFIDETFMSTILHETGHNLGMQHNFIGHDAYTAKELQDPNFTAKNGIATTVMEYAPLNIWPRGTPQGDFHQKVLGPYDYYAMKYAYAPIPGATTPDSELPTLERWAQAWSNPLYRYASDEDTAWANGHAADPRVEQGELTNDQLGWTEVQLRMNRALLDRYAQLLPRAGRAYEDASLAFGSTLQRYLMLASKTAHFIGGQYLSRAHRGDPGADPPISPVPLAVQQRAFRILSAYLFSDEHLKFSPVLLDKLGYSEWAGYGYVEWDTYGNLPLWAYNPPPQHDYPLTEHIARIQSATLDQLLQPLVLQRLERNPLLTRGHTLSMSGFFDWMQGAIFSEITWPGARNISLLRRNLQSMYVTKLLAVVNSPAAGTPSDAQALARLELKRVQSSAEAKAHDGGLDEATQAHLVLLAQRAAGTAPR
ncbi:MAG TPA: zinc-dependent metalloprotease [Candidatus Baltobacteraceae bacterium]|jgi:hypothetical protein